VQAEAKQGIHSLLRIAGSGSAISRKAGLHHMILGKTNTVTLNVPPLSSFFPQLYTLSRMSYGMGYPLGQLGSALPAVSPPSSSCTPSLLAGGVVRGAGKALTLCKHCSAIAKTPLCYQCCFQHKSKA